MDGVYEIGDDTLLVRANAINSIDKEYGRPGRSDLGKQRHGIRDRQAQARCELCPAVAGQAVILQKENGTVRRRLIGIMLQDSGLATTRKAANGNDPVKFELRRDLALEFGALDVEVIYALGNDI